MRIHFADSSKNRNCKIHGPYRSGWMYARDFQLSQALAVATNIKFEKMQVCYIALRLHIFVYILLLGPIVKVFGGLT
jgi:hypothetical protein